MRTHRITTAAALFAACAGASAGAQLPTDVRAGHWAGASVQRALKAGLLRLQPDGRFHGEAKVTRLETAVALSTLGRALVEGTWKPIGRSRAVPDSVTQVWEKTNWKSEPVRRYAFAVILTRLGDYVANGLPRPAAGAKVGLSEALTKVDSVPAGPGHDALAYLAANRMIQPGSLLLKPNGDTVKGGELGKELTELTAGVVDRLTDLGKNADGSTPDDAFHKKAPR